MAKSQDAKMFFPGSRRRLRLTRSGLLLNAQDERRLKLEFSMPLTGEPLPGMPPFVGKAFELVSEPENGNVSTEIGIELEGVTVEFFPTEKGRRAQMLTGATVRKLEVYRTASTNTQKRSPDVFLGFVITTPGSAELNGWGYENLGATLWAQFTETQATLSFGEKKDENQGALDLDDKLAGTKPGPGAADDDDDEPAARRRKAH